VDPRCCDPPQGTAGGGNCHDFVLVRTKVATGYRDPAPAWLNLTLELAASLLRDEKARCRWQ
jgi:hypothetical protein